MRNPLIIGCYEYSLEDNLNDLNDLERDNPGWQIRIATENEIMLDIDLADEEKDNVNRIIDKIGSAIDLIDLQHEGIEFFRSKSNNLHCIIQLIENHNYSILERIALQLALGSDPVREGLCIIESKANMGIGVCLLMKIGEKPIWTSRR
jgi:hypothetical protein